MGMWLRHIIVTVQSNKLKERQVITGKEWSFDRGVKKERPQLVLSQLFLYLIKHEIQVAMSHFKHSPLQTSVPRYEINQNFQFNIAMLS